MEGERREREKEERGEDVRIRDEQRREEEWVADGKGEGRGWDRRVRKWERWKRKDGKSTCNSEDKKRGE